MSGSRDSAAGQQSLHSPEAVGQSKRNRGDPAEIAMRLANHDAFRRMSNETPPPTYSTPPPRYSRLAQPRLTLEIPEQVPKDDDAVNIPATTTAPSDAIAIQSVDSSPVEVVQRTVQAFSITNRIKSKLWKGGSGVRDRLRRSSGNSRSSSTASSPSESLGSRVYELDSTDNTTSTQVGLEAVQELDGQSVAEPSRASCNVRQITGVREQISHVSPQTGPSTMGMYNYLCAKEETVSSIVPTPRQGLSTRSRVRRPGSVAALDAEDLSGRLRSLGAAARSSSRSEVSPCQAGPRHDAFGTHTILARSNAITNSIAPVHDIVSPISPTVSGPPTSPTLDGRLNGLPRLATSILSNAAAIDVTFRGRRQQTLSEMDSGKELVVSQAASRLDCPLNMPQWDQVPRHPSHRDSTSPSPLFVSNAYHAQQQDSSSPWVRRSTRRRVSLPASQRRAMRDPRANVSINHYQQVLSKLLELAGFRTAPCPPIPDQHVRVRWRCSCGEDLYDDFVERYPGAAAALEEHLNGEVPILAHSPQSSQPTSAVPSVFSSAFRSSSLSPSSDWSSPVSPTQRKQTCVPLTPVAHQQSPVSCSRPFMEPLWLYALANEGNGVTKMRHLDISMVRSDADLAAALKKVYYQGRRSWLQCLKLRALRHIRFVQFELHRNRIADVRHSVCGLDDTTIIEELGYDTATSGLSPLVGPNYIEHLLMHMEDFDNENLACRNAPKRSTRLGLGTGLGVELVEDFVPERVRAALKILLVGALGTFLLSWMCTSGNDMLFAAKTAGTAFVTFSVLLLSVQGL